MVVIYKIDSSVETGKKTMEKIADNITTVALSEKIIEENAVDVIDDFKKLYPDKTIIADIKTNYEIMEPSRLCFMMGADMVSVSIAADASRIRELMEYAHENGKKVCLDISDTEPRFYKTFVDKINEIAPDYVIFNFTGEVFADEPGIFARKDAILLLKKLEINSKLILSGAITTEYAVELNELKPEGVMVEGVIERSLFPLNIIKKLETI